MVEQMSGFPYWQVTFDEQGVVTDPVAIDALLSDLPGQALTDLFIYSHGWNVDFAMARAQYAAYFDQLQALINDPSTPHPRPAAVGTIGVIWPSMRWPDEQLPATPSGGTAGLAASPSTGDTIRALKQVYPAPAQQQALDDLAALLTARPADAQQLERFQQLLRPLVSANTPTALEDNGEQSLLTANLRQILPLFAALGRGASRGGAADLGNPLDRLWSGALEVLRAATYFEMKQRAGTVGSTGLGPLVGRLHATQPDLRIHLLGHSFGARLVSYALSGLPQDGGPSPLKTVFLLQGAFSHFAFAPSLPQDPARSGGLAGMQARVDGPLLVSHSVHDLAVGQLYPLASMASQDDAAAIGNALDRWGAMGHDGAQAVQAADCVMGPVGQSYPFRSGAFVNLNGDAVIIAGSPPSGAHGDINHPQLAWATLAAAGILGPSDGSSLRQPGP